MILKAPNPTAPRTKYDTCGSGTPLGTPSRVHLVRQGVYTEGYTGGVHRSGPEKKRHFSQLLQNERQLGSPFHTFEKCLRCGTRNVSDAGTRNVSDAGRERCQIQEKYQIPAELLDSGRVKACLRPLLALAARNVSFSFFVRNVSFERLF